MMDNHVTPKEEASTPAAVGMFDSGVGGLSVLREVRRQMPGHPVIYVADQAHVPYGPRPVDEVREFSQGITRFLLAQGARVIVVACNTASAAALHYLRQIFPDVPFVGMEPAVKPAAAQTQTRVVGVLATPATFQGELFASTVDRFAAGITILKATCPGLVGQIEAGNLDGSRTRGILEDMLQPMLQQGVDTIVLGCTHYPFVIPLIQEIVGEGVSVIDPSPAVARQTGRLLAAYGLAGEDAPRAGLRFYTSGNVESFRLALGSLLGEDGEVHPAAWQGANLHALTGL